MLKVKMLVRHTGPAGKMEQGFEYLLPASYAQELIDHGLAVLVLPGAMSPPVNVTMQPTKTTALATALREMRAKNQGIIDGPKKRK